MHHTHIWCCSHHSWKMVIFSLSLTVRHRNHSEAIEKPVFFRSHFILHIKQWCPFPSQKLSGILHALLISLHHTELTPARGSAFHRKQSPVKNLLENTFAAQIKQEGKKWWHRECWATAEFKQVCDGPALSSEQQKTKERLTSSPRCEFFPQKTNLTFTCSLLAAFTVSWLWVQQGAGSGADSQCTTGQPRQMDVTAQLRPCLICRTALQWLFMILKCETQKTPKVSGLKKQSGWIQVNLTSLVRLRACCEEEQHTEQRRMGLSC